MLGAARRNTAYEGRSRADWKNSALSACFPALLGYLWQSSLVKGMLLTVWQSINIQHAILTATCFNPTRIFRHISPGPWEAY